MWVRFPPAAFLLLFTAILAVKVTGFANEIAFGDGAKPISTIALWVVIAQQVRDSTVNSNESCYKIYRRGLTAWIG